jgi:hypothetical protein
MKTKICNKCKESLGLECFTKHSKNKDGLQANCRKCGAKIAKEKISKLKASPSDWMIFNEKRRVYQRAYMRRAYSSGAIARPPLDEAAASAKLHRERHPERYRARYLAYGAIKHGNLVRQPCTRCGAKKVEAHHEDYSLPYEITWLCKKHHAARHVELNAEMRCEKCA